jgi:hypothetical protein
LERRFFYALFFLILMVKMIQEDDNGIKYQESSIKYRDDNGMKQKSEIMLFPFSVTYSFYYFFSKKD